VGEHATNTTATTGATSTLTMDKIDEMMRNVRKLMADAPPAPPRVPIYISDHLGMWVPNRVLKDRAWHNPHDRRHHACYARRVQKKWLKRFGQHQLPQIIQSKLGIFVSRSTYERLRSMPGVRQEENFYGFSIPGI
jgi:hypothetical protein